MVAGKMTEASAQPTDPGPEDNAEEPTFAGYPPGCPLSEAIPAEGVAFRVTLNDPPTMADFLSHHEQGIEPKPGSTVRQRCRWRSVSVFLTIDDARHLRKRYPERWGTGYIAAGRLTQKMGQTLLTPSPDKPTHTEWWRADGVDPLPHFKVVD
jgi:hypothetical protein